MAGADHYRAAGRSGKSFGHTQDLTGGSQPVSKRVSRRHTNITVLLAGRNVGQLGKLRPVVNRPSSACAAKVGAAYAGRQADWQSAAGWQPVDNPMRLGFRLYGGSASAVGQVVRGTLGPACAHCQWARRLPACPTWPVQLRVAWRL